MFHFSRPTMLVNLILHVAWGLCHPNSMARMNVEACMFHVVIVVEQSKVII